MFTGEKLTKAAWKDRRRAAARQAATHAKWEEVAHGAGVMDSVIRRHCASPWALAGLAYTAGVAEGKQLERDRRRRAKPK